MINSIMVFFAAAAENEVANRDLILRLLIGMAFIMSLMFLAAIATGVIGRMREKKLSGQEGQPSDNLTENDSEILKDDDVEQN